MKKNRTFVVIVVSVSLLHAVGIYALSSFKTESAQLMSAHKELTFVELGGSEAAALPQAAAVAVEPKPKPKTEIKRTKVDKPKEHTVFEPKTKPKPEPKPPEKPVETPKEKPLPLQQNANANVNKEGRQDGKADGKGQQASGQGSGRSDNTTGLGSGNQKGGGGGGDGSRASAKIDGTASCLKAVYPTESEERGEEGRVVVVLVVGTSGNVVSAAVQSSSGSRRLDKAALRQAQTCRFKPALQGGIPVQTRFSAPYNYRLRR